MKEEGLKILVVDDEKSTLLLLSRCFRNEGHIMISAVNGEEAVEQYEIEKPDLILMDINMPLMDGLEATRIIKESQQGVGLWTPIIILSSLKSDNAIIAGINAGADDYLPKPINLSVLSAKVKSMQRLIKLQKENNRSNEENKKSHQTLLKMNHAYEQEQLLAKGLVDKMLNLSALAHSSISYWSCPNNHFNGDLILISEEVGNKRYVMLADSTGHGLSAALPTITVARIFHAMTAKGFNLSSIVKEMNCSTKNTLPSDHFVATSLFMIDIYHHTIEYWMGGAPTAFLVNSLGELLYEFESKEPAIGILSASLFNSTTELFHWNESCELIVYSDGLTEARSPRGDYFGDEALMDLLSSQVEGNRVSIIKQNVLGFMNAEHGHDDISLLSIECKC